MGEVFRVTDLEAKRLVAYKVMFSHLDCTLHRGYFLTEANLTARLEHPAIVRVYAVVKDGCGRPGYSMEFIDGNTLHNEIARPIPEGRQNRTARLRHLLAHFVAVCEAVQFAHDKLVTHGDIKAANVRVRTDGATFVMDWGLARQHTGSIPPEDLAIDRKGLANLLVEILKGMNLPPSLSATYKGAEEYGKPPTLATAKADWRYPSAAAIGAAVRGWLTDGSSPDYRDWRTVRLWRWANRHQAWATSIAAGVLLAFLMTLGGMWVARLEEKRQSEARYRGERVWEAVLAVNEAASEGRLTAATASLERASGALGPNPPENLLELVANAERVLKLAVELDDIRQELSVRRSDPQLPDDGVTKRYTKAFADAGIDPNAADAVDRIRSSPIRTALVSALDDWASSRYTASPDGGVPVTRLLELACEVDPDPDWGDLFRDPLVRANPKKLAALAARAPLDRLTPAQVSALVTALPPTDPSIPKLLATVESRRPNDFGVILANASWRLATLRTGGSSPQLQEAIAYARTASALRPDSLAALTLLAELYDLSNQPQELEAIADRIATLGRESWMSNQVAALAARKRGQYQEWLALLEKSSAAAGHPPRMRIDVAIANFATAEFDVGQNVVEQVLAKYPHSEEAIILRALFLLFRGQVAEAEKIARGLLVTAPNNEASKLVLAYSMFAQGRIIDGDRIVQSLPKHVGFYGDKYLAGYVKLLNGDYDSVLHFCMQVERQEKSNGLEFLKYLAFAGLGRYDEARKALVASQAPGGTPMANVIPGSSLGIFLRKTNLDEYAKLSSAAEKDRVGMRQQVNFSKLNVMSRSVLHYAAEVFLAKRQYVSASLCFREYFFGATLLAGQNANVMSWGLGFGTYRFHAIRAMAQASVGGGKDGFLTTDKDRAECRTDALRWLKDEITICKEYASRDPSSGTNQTIGTQDTRTAANIRLHCLRLHVDLEPIRNKDIIAKMPEADRKMAEELWAEVEKLFDKLNPPLNISDLPER